MKIEIRANGQDGRSDIVIDGKTVYTNWNYDFAPYVLRSLFQQINPKAQVEFIQGFEFKEEDE